MIRAERLGDPAQPLLGIPIPQDEEHLKDASHFTGTAQKIFYPTDEEQICHILREAQKTSTPLTVSGAGTGLTGGRVPQGGNILCTEKMNKIQKIRWDNAAQQGTVLLEPGVTLQALEQALEAQGLFYPPNPGEKAAFLGGTAATNASGSRSFKYGMTRRHVKRLRVALPSGQLLDITRGNEKVQNGSFAIIFSDGKNVTFKIPTYPQPKTKNSAGYFSESDMDLIDLFIGSEGTLGIITLLELEVLRKPDALISGILFFESEKSCFSFSEEIKRLARDKENESSIDPRALEYFDSQSLLLLYKKYPYIPRRAKAALYYEQECSIGMELELRSIWIDRSESFQALPTESWFADWPEGHETFRKFRYDLPVLVNEEASRRGLQKVATDLAVPDAQAQAMFDFYLSELPKSGLDFAIWGHLGDNHLHANLLPKSEEQFRQAEDLYGTLVDKAVQLGGTVSAEHGIGKLRIPYLEKLVGREGLLEMARVKRALDPNGILNPGNIIPPELLKNC